MTQTIVLSSVRGVRVGAKGLAVIAGKDHSGDDIDVIIQSADIGTFIEPLLCCAALESFEPDRSLPIGTVVPGCHLPVISWKTGLSNVNGKPALILTVAGGTELTFEFPPESAQDCGRALEQTAKVAAPADETRPN